ncbi:MAG: hypothetical protein CMI31_10150, partial [Opitutae bacterium]|nr:hypothetical protein [Opitutae bacterium]
MNGIEREAVKIFLRRDERSVLTDKHVFAHMLYADGLLEDVEYAIYTRWFDEFLEEMPAPEVVSVRTTPDTCMV